MRIGLDASKVTPPRDGIGSYTRGLLGALASLDHDAEVLLYGSLHPLTEADVERALPGLPERFRLAPGRWPRSGEVDLFHATTWSFPVGFRGPVVVSCYDLTFLSHPQTHRLENKVHCTEGLLEALLAGATFLAISEATRRELEARLELPAERLRVIYPAADERFQRLSQVEAAARVRERFGVEGGYLLSVGTLEPRKNLRRLLEAYAGLPEGVRRDHPLLIAGGRGWDDLDLAAAVRREPELAGVRLLGYVEDDDLPALYRRASLLVYPSLAEGFGLPALEALRCGTPVVASTAGALPEVVGDAGRLVDPHDAGALTAALVELLGDAAALEALGARAREQAERFSWRRAARETLELYESLLRTAGRAEPR